MEEPRLTRRERQALTRDRLIEVASDELLRSGFRGTSLERVAEAAGFSKGAVYSNFASKEDLVLAVLDQRFRHRLDRLRDRLEAAPETVEDRLSTFSTWWAELVTEQGWGVLIFELASHSRDKPEIRQQMTQREVAIVDFVAMLIAAEAERFDIALAMPARDLATVLVSLGSGLSFSAMLEPSTPVDVMATVARLVLLGHT